MDMQRKKDDEVHYRFSIIIPYFNTPSAVFSKCIQSILEQEYTNYEVIVVDDGSDEKFVNDLKRICDNRKIQLYRKCNEGVSAARNYGMSIAQGDYITFVDSDDEVVSGFLAEANRILNKHHTKLIIGGLVCDNEKYNASEFNFEKVKIYRDSEVNGFKKHIIDEWLMLDDGGHVNRGPVCRIVAKELAISCKFDNNIRIGEDMLWNLSMLSQVSEFCVAKRVWYKYRYNPDSATHTYNPDIIALEEAELNALKQYIDFNNTDEYLSYTNHIFECLKRVHDCYLSPRWKKDRKKRGEILRLNSSPVWSGVLENRYFKLAPKRHKIKTILYRTRMLFFVWDIKDIICGRKSH